MRALIVFGLLTSCCSFPFLSMMAVKVVWLILLLPVSTLALGRNDPCTTPNGESAICKSIADCKVIKDAILSRDKQAVDFAKTSQCGYDSQPLVCCGTSATLQPFGESCTTPNGEEATCVPLSSCKILSDAVTTRNKDAVDFARKSRCKNPLNVCCGSEAYPVRSNLLPNRRSCGEEKGEDRIWGGEIAELWEFPWMALLGYKNGDGSDAGFKCGGTLINKRYILTAAHCVDVNLNLGIDLDRVRLGEWKISQKIDCEEKLAVPECADPVVDVKISEKIVHSQYNKKGGKNDIALLRLERNVQFSDYIQPICLPVRESPIPEPGTLMVVAGWGATENSSNSDHKLKVKLPIVSKEECRSKIRVRGGVNDQQICAGGQSGKDSCQGDSGGPLMNVFSKNLNIKQRWYQEGVVSWGVGCGIIGYPAVYTRIANYMDWIIDNLKN